jgi:hypothetical protein
VALVGAGVEVGVGDQVEQQLRRDLRSAVLLGHQGERGGHVAADAADQDDPGRR